MGLQNKVAAPTGFFNVAFSHFTIPFKQPLRTAKGEFSAREGFVLAAALADGTTLRGEVSPLPGLSEESLSDVEAVLPKLVDFLNQTTPPMANEEIQSLLERLSPVTSDLPSVEFGVETLLANSAAYYRQVPVAAIYNLKFSPQVEINSLLSGGDFALVQQIDRGLRQGRRCFKLKVLNDGRDISRIRNVRQRIGERAKLRLDANEGFTPDQAYEFLQQASDYGIEYIEDPVPKLTTSVIQKLRSTGVPIAADETTRQGQDYSGCSYLIVKPTLIGGIQKSIDVGNTARERGVEPVVTSTLESEIGIAACREVASALNVRVACGLGTLELFQLKK